MVVGSGSGIFAWFEEGQHKVQRCSDVLKWYFQVLKVLHQGMMGSCKGSMSCGECPLMVAEVW